MSWNGFQNLDLTGVQEAGDPLLEPGKHIVKCIEAKVESVSGTPNQKLVLQFQGGGGQIRSSLNIHHVTSPQAQEIALRQLKSFLVCAGHPNPDKPGGVETMEGLEVGVIVGEGKPYTNKEGRVVTPKEVKRFFESSKFDEIEVRSSAAAPRASERQQIAAQNKAMQDDDIPF